MACDSEYVVIWTEHEIESEHRLLLRHQRYQLQSGLSIDKTLELETYAIDGCRPLGQHRVENGRAARDLVAECRSSGVENSLAVGPQVVADARQSTNRSVRKSLGEDGKPRPVIEMDVGEDNSIDGLGKPVDVRCRLFCVGQKKLAIEHNELGRSLDDLCVGEEAVLGAYVCVNLDVAVLAHAHLAT